MFEDCNVWTILVEFPHPRENECFVIGKYSTKEEAEKVANAATYQKFYGDGTFKVIPVAASW